MKTRKLGDLEVSEIGIGCMGFSHGYGKVPAEEYSISAIQAAYEFGCTFFDTAEVYGGQGSYYFGHNEELLGRALEGVRDQAVVATKYRPVASDISQLDHLDDVIRRHLDASLKRLRTDHVDLYYLHRVHRQMPVESVAQVMARLIDDGVIRGWGLSQVDRDTLARAHAVTPVAAVQNLYNMLERDCETDIFPFCLERGIGVVPFSPIASGLLSGKVTVDTQYEEVDDVRVWVPQLSKANVAGNQPIVDMLGVFAAKKGASSAQISLAWMLHKYPNVVPIPGSKNRERILENLGACRVELTDAEFGELEAALDACTVHGHRGHVEMIE